MPFVCDACGHRQDPAARLAWYEGTGADLDEAGELDAVYLCAQCYQRLDAEEKPRWRPVR